MRRLVHQPFGDHHLLLVAARQRADRDIGARPIRMPSSRTISSTAAFSARADDDRRPRETLSSAAKVRLSRTDIGSIRPSVLRSSGISAMPMSAFLASFAGCGRHRLARRPGSRRVTPRSAPNSASSISICPCPSRPPRPRISPRPHRNGNVLQAVFPGQLRVLQRRRGLMVGASAWAERRGCIRARSSFTPLHIAPCRRVKVATWRPLRNTEQSSASSAISLMRCEI